MSQLNQYRFIDLIRTITGNAGGAVGGDLANNIDVVGDGTTINIVGTPLTNTLTISTTGAIASSYLTDDLNSAVPALGVLTVAGGTNIGTTSAGSTVTINLDDAITLTTVNATTFDTNIAAAGVTLAGTTLSADGTDADISINITAKGTGQVIIDDLEISGLTAGTVRSSATGDISSLADGADGALLIGKTGDVPIWATLTDGNNITCTEGANSISIAVTGTTDNSLQVGNATGSLSSLAVGADGTVLIGNTAADPSFSANPILTTVYATTFDTNVVAAAVTLSGTTLAADGTNANIDLTLTPKGTGSVVITGLTAGTIRSSATGDISSLADGADGTLLIGKTGDVPIWATLTDGNNITATEGANSISIAVTGTTEHAVQIGSAAAALTSLAVGATGEILIGNTTADPTWSATPTVTTIYATTFDTNVAAAGTTLSGTTWAADGTDANIDLTLTPKGTGSVVLTGLTAGTLRSSATGEVSSLADGADGTLLIGKTGDVPIWATLTDGNNITCTEGANSISIAVTGTTQYALQVGDATGSLDSLGIGTATQILQSGGAGANPAWSTATYPATAAIGTILIASAANTITTLAPDTAGYVLTDGGAGVAPSWQPNATITWARETDAAVAIVVNHGYINTNVGLTTFTLPATAAIGTAIEILGESAAGWTIAQNAGQNIQYGSASSTAGAGGSVSSSNRYDTIRIICRVADTTWSVVSSVGVLNVI